MSNFDNPYASSSQPQSTIQSGPSGPPVSGLAIASLVCGILATVSAIFSWICCCGFPFNVIILPVAMILGLIAGITGYIGMQQCQKGEKSGWGMGLAGVITGVIGLIVAGIMLLLMIFVFGFAAAAPAFAPPPQPNF